MMDGSLSLLDTTITYHYHYHFLTQKSPWNEQRRVDDPNVATNPFAGIWKITLF